MTQRIPLRGGIDVRQQGVLVGLGQLLSACDADSYRFAIEVLELPAINRVVVGEVQGGVVDAVQSAADGAAEAYTEERAVGYDKDAAAWKFPGQCFQGVQPAAGSIVLGFCPEIATGDPQFLQFGAGAQAFCRSEAPFGKIRHSPGNVAPQPGGNQIGCFSGTAQR